jgi:protease PrsW
MTRYSAIPGLLTPPREEEEVYPYRRVWPSIIAEVGVLFGVVLLVFIVVNVFGSSLPESLRTPVNIALVLLPALLWLVFSYSRERLAVEPRRSLLSVFLVSALVANAVTIPLLNYLQIDQWLSLSGSVDRLLGYTLTIGIIHELTRYVIVRYLTWPAMLRTRLDSLAYGAAAAVGYVTVINLHMIAEGQPLPDMVGVRVFSAVVVHLAAAGIVSYGLAVVRFNPRTVIILPLTLVAAAFVHGVAVPVWSGLVNANFLLGLGATRPLFGLIFSFAMVSAALMVIAFLFNVAEREEREAIASREV